MSGGFPDPEPKSGPGRFDDIALCRPRQSGRTHDTGRLGERANREVAPHNSLSREAGEGWGGGLWLAHEAGRPDQLGLGGSIENALPR